MIGKASHNTTADHEALRALRQVALFRRLSQEALANPAAVAHQHCYAHGDYLWGINEVQESVYTMVRGTACFCRTTREGCEIMLPPLHPGDVFGIFNVEQAIMSEVYAKVMVDGTALYRLPRRHVLRLTESYPEIAVDALEQVWCWLTDAYECIEDRAEPLKPRLARTLVRLAAAGGDAVEATHEELAAMVGTSREEVTRALAEFRRRGLIAKRSGRRGIVLVNKRRLANR